MTHGCTFVVESWNLYCCNCVLSLSMMHLDGHDRFFLIVYLFVFAARVVLLSLLSVSSNSIFLCF